MSLYSLIFEGNDVLILQLLIFYSSMKVLRRNFIIFISKEALGGRTSFYEKGNTRLGDIRGDG